MASLSTPLPTRPRQVGGVRCVACAFEAEGDTVLELERPSSLGASGTLQGALEALLPRGCRPCRLHLRHAARALLPAGALEGCTALAQLDALSLDQSPLEEAALAALLASAPRLQELVTSESLPVQGQLPAAVRDRRGWARLALMDEGLADLPTGPFLQGEAVMCGAGQGGVRRRGRRLHPAAALAC